MSSNDAKEFVDKVISNHKVVVFSKTYCPYCTKAKNVLKKYSINDLHVIELDEADYKNNCESIQDYLRDLTKARTVPRVFINGRCIGGGDDTLKLDNTNKLENLLKECGAI